MKRMIALIICSTLLLVLNKPTNNRDIITEEALPIRNNDLIESMDYRLILNSNTEDKIIYETKVIDSINHYLNLFEKDHFMVNLKLINNSHSKYHLKRIVITNNTEVIKIYNYDKEIDYTIIELDLTKEIIEKITKNNKVSGVLKIIIEK